MCVFACKSPFGGTRREPCKECKAKYDELMDAEYEYYQHRKAIKAFRLWLKSLATDWEAPSQVALVKENPNSPFIESQLTTTTSITEDEFPWV